MVPYGLNGMIVRFAADETRQGRTGMVAGNGLAAHLKGYLKWTEAERGPPDVKL